MIQGVAFLDKCAMVDVTPRLEARGTDVFCVICEDTWQPQGCVCSSASFFIFIFSLCAFFFLALCVCFFLDFIFPFYKVAAAWHDMLCCCAALSGTPCLICERGEEARTGAVCFTPATTSATARRSGSWWTLHPRTSQNRRTPPTRTEVCPLPAASLSVCFCPVCGIKLFLSDARERRRGSTRWENDRTTVFLLCNYFCCKLRKSVY